MTEDDRIDSLLRQMAAEDYNRPPEIVPRELMWDAVARELGRREPGTGNGGVLPLPRAPRIPRWIYFAAAAVVLFAVGIQLGRHMGGGRVQPAVAVLPDAPAARDTVVPGGGSPGASSLPSPSRQVATAAQGGRSDDSTGPRATRGPAPAPGRAVPNDAADVAYTMAATQHLAQVEVLLTTFRSDAAQGRMDAQLASWGKELLANTRLLLDSPAARDPVRRRLLQDLELVLVQIVQLSPGAPARDRDLITGALTDDQVLTRLRTAIPGQKGT